MLECHHKNIPAMLRVGYPDIRAPTPLDARKGINCMAEYLLGHSTAELQRLTLQAELLRPITERMLHDAGLRPGMRVLDLGCGAGDVSLLAAELVGPNGYVVGVDRVASATEFATSRAEREGVRNVAFRQGTEASLGEEASFDFAVGRYVLPYQSDPAGFVRTVAARLRRGGIVAFHEFDLSGTTSFPPIPVFDRVVNELVHAFRASISSPDVGTRLASIFAEAGLMSPSGFCERLVGMEGSELCFRWVAATYATVRSAVDPDGEPIEVERLAAEFEAAVAAVHGQALVIDQWCAWALV